MLQADFPALVGDSERNPVFAGMHRPGRSYRRDFVVNIQHDLYLCNVVSTVEDGEMLRSEEGRWTLISSDFTPLDLCTIKEQELKPLTLTTLVNALRKGYCLSGKHPNVVVQGERKLLFCNDCEVTYPDPYMVHNRIWNEVVGERVRCFLCLKCLETRLGRRLVIQDFTPAPINDGIRFGFNLAITENHKQHQV